MHKQISKHFLPLLQTEENSHLLFFTLSCLLFVDFFSIYMLQLVGQHKAPFPGEEEQKQNGRHHERQREKERAVHANNVVSMVGPSALPGYPGSQAVKSQLETQCGRTAFP